MIDKWKLLIEGLRDHGGQPDKNGAKGLVYRRRLPPKTICTETYIVAGVFENRVEAERLAQYLRTRFVRFLIAQLSFSQDITKDRFFFVPTLKMNTQWTDDKLYKRYDLTKDEVAFIESKIRPMEANGE